MYCIALLPYYLDNYKFKLILIIDFLIYLRIFDTI